MFKRKQTIGLVKLFICSSQKNKQNIDTENEVIRSISIQWQILNLNSPFPINPYPVFSQAQENPVSPLCPHSRTLAFTYILGAWVQSIY